MKLLLDKIILLAVFICTCQITATAKMAAQSTAINKEQQKEFKSLQKKLEKHPEDYNYKAFVRLANICFT